MGGWRTPSCFLAAHLPCSQLTWGHLSCKRESMAVARGSVAFSSHGRFTDSETGQTPHHRCCSAQGPLPSKTGSAAQGMGRKVEQGPGFASSQAGHPCQTVSLPHWLGDRPPLMFWNAPLRTLKTTHLSHPTPHFPLGVRKKNARVSYSERFLTPTLEMFQAGSDGSCLFLLSFPVSAFTFKQGPAYIYSLKNRKIRPVDSAGLWL